jgi:hypothetical protein
MLWLMLMRYTAIPVEVLDAEDMAIYMGRDYFRVYTTALKMLICSITMLIQLMVKCLVLKVIAF